MTGHAVTEDGVGTLRRMPSTTGTMRKLLSEVADIKSVVTGRSRDADAKIKSMVRGALATSADYLVSQISRAIWGRCKRAAAHATGGAAGEGARPGGRAQVRGRLRPHGRSGRAQSPYQWPLDLLLMHETAPLLALGGGSQAIAQDLKQQHQRLQQLHRESEREWRAQLAAIRKAVQDLHGVLPSAQGALARCRTKTANACIA